MKIKITPKGLIFFQIIFNVLYKMLEIINIGTDKLNYVSHFVAIYLLFFLLTDRSKKMEKYIKSEIVITIMLLVITIIGIFVVPLCYSDILINMSLGTYLKGFLNFYRFFVFFFAVIEYLEFDDIKEMFTVLGKIFVLNVVLCCFEYFVMGCEQDYLGGVFGVKIGGNVGLNILLCFFSAFYALKYVNKKTSLLFFVLIEIVCVLLATMAELKLYYIELVVIMIMAVLLVKPNINTFKIIFSSVLILGVGLYVLSVIFPEQLRVFVDSDTFSKYTGGSYVRGSLGRVTMFQELEGYFFQDYPIVRVFGFGIGTFDPTSSGYWAKTYSYLRAGWFGNSSILLNFGYIGLVLIYVFYINLARKALVWRRKFEEEEKLYVDFSLIMIMIMLLSLWYNTTVITGTTAYLLYFVIAIPTILYKRNMSKS